MEGLAKKYGYANRQRIQEFIEIYKNRELISQYLRERTLKSALSHISRYRALRVLKQLKTEEKPQPAAEEKPLEIQAEEKLLLGVTTISFKALNVNAFTLREHITGGISPISWFKEKPKARQLVFWNTNPLE
ncbi:MAG: hypothetical protein QXF44_03480, partial [Candidatus Bathyarchaeia archaeon]